MPFTHPRLAREAKTIAAMINIYCHNLHGTKRELCAECADLQAYAFARLEKCPFQEEKTTCVDCAVHCYKPDMRERVRQVMRYAGPRMTFRHPYLAFMHLVVDSRKKEAKRPVRKAKD